MPRRYWLRFTTRSALTAAVIRIIGWLLPTLFVALILSSSCDAAGNDKSNIISQPTAYWITWHTDQFFSSCNGNCAVSLFGGQQVRTHMTDIFATNPSLPWDWRWGHSQLAGGAISRRLVTFWDALDIEPELGVAKRFGDMHADETWLALYFRWTRFPWNEYIRTSVALSLGISYAVDLPNSHAAPILNYFSPEITFSLPSYQKYMIFIRFHHRSNFWIGKASDPGWQYLTIGLRYHF